MREIKFRAWDTQNNEMITGIGITPESDLATPYLINHCVGDPSGCAYYPMSVIMQYTGLKDKNKVAIYEGDIVTGYYDEYSEYWDETTTIELSSQVEFADGAFCIRREYLNNEGRLRGPAITKDWDAETVVVIGNIYENPELLETKK